MRIDEPRENDVILEGVVNFMGYATQPGLQGFKCANRYNPALCDRDRTRIWPTLIHRVYSVCRQYF